MITAKELMVSNILEYFGQKVIILAINRDETLELGYFNDSIGFTRQLSEAALRPVKLTPDILERHGFIRVKARKGVACAFVKNGIRLNMSNSANFYYHRWNTVNYLHELQNLYFIITGEQLIIEQ